MIHDMQLLREFWDQIPPEHALGNNAKHMRRSRVYKTREQKRIEKAKKDADVFIEKVKERGGFDKLSNGFKGFCHLHGISLQ